MEGYIEVLEIEKIEDPRKKIVPIMTETCEAQEPLKYQSVIEWPLFMYVHEALCKYKTYKIINPKIILQILPMLANLFNTFYLI